MFASQLFRRVAPAIGSLFLVAAPLQAANLPVETQQSIRASTFEVVMKKPEKDPLSYEKPLPLELLPYIERTDHYRSIGTAFALGHNTYVTAAHVMLAGVGSQYGPPSLRRSDGTVFEIAEIQKFSAYQDFVVFSLRNDPAPAGLAVNQEPRVDDPVFAVGNALGEGIVIRDGLYTSATAEEQDGRWKWIRFSAAASPGNSGGPLLDAQGRVIGIVIGKSPNENLNYSLPISEVLTAPERKARFDQRQLVSLPYLQGTQTYAFQDGFDLPVSWAEFSRSYTATIARHEEKSFTQLLTNYSASEFPKGGGTESVLYAPEANEFRPRLIMQQDDGSWAGGSASYATTDLAGDGSVEVANVSGVVLLHVVRPDNASDPGFYANSKALMDLALKGLNLRRPVGSDHVRITSLGEAISDVTYLDPYGRKWQERAWAVPFMDVYLTALLLPTPDGYCGVIQYQPSGLRTILQQPMRLLATQMDVSYTGTVAQWKAFLAQRALLPAALAEVKLETAPQWALRTPRFLLSVPPSALKLSDNSVLSLTMGFYPEKNQVVWGVEEAWWHRDAQLKAAIGLARRAQPPKTAKLELRSHFDDMRARRAPYDGDVSREDATTSSVSTILDAPVAKPGLVAADLLYGLTLRTDESHELANLPEALQQLAATTQILEHGEGEGVVPSQALAASWKEKLDAYTEELGKYASEADKTYGKDMRGRVPSEDMRDLLADTKILSDVPGANLELLATNLQSKSRMLSNYWITAMGIRNNREIWSDFLARNHLPPDTPHSEQVISMEQALMTVLSSGGPREEWAALGEQLRVGYVRERKAAMRPATPGEADFHARLSPCPAVAAETSGSEQVKVGTMYRTPDDFYPEVSRKAYLEGSVALALNVSATGCAESLALIGSSGSLLLDEAAIRFGETIGYLPAEKAGKAVEAKYRLLVTFKLK